MFSFKNKTPQVVEHVFPNTRMLGKSYYLKDTGQAKHVEHNFHGVFLVLAGMGRALAGGEKHSGIASFVY